MEKYSFVQWVLIFYLFSFFGWILESCFVSFTKKRIVNRGFCLGPWIPLYGCGGVVMLFVALPFYDSAIMVFFAGMLGASALEYITGVVMEKIFSIRYWNYIGTPFASKNGYISLPTSIVWGGLTLILTYVWAPWINSWIFDIRKTTEIIIALILTILFVSDTIMSVKTALNIKDTAQLISVINKEIEGIQDKLHAEVHRVWLEIPEETRSAIAESDTVEMLKEIHSELGEQRSKNADIMYRKYLELHTRREAVLQRVNWFMKQTIKGNPNATSTLAGFEHIRARIENRIEAGINILKEYKDDFK
ncbi:MAG: putative ABC transporter permease [Eubacteriales bacterium]|nr:putative ABC transporter permease [Eubacteriales bacterium]